MQVGVDIGFSGDRLVAAEVAPSPVRHPSDAVRLDFYANLERRLRALPFVGGVGLSTVFQPFGAVRGGSVFRIEGRPNPATEGGEWPWADLRTAVNADFLCTFEVSSIAGRPLTESDVSVVASLDSETPVSRIRPVDDVMAQAVSRPRFTTALVLGFAVLGVVLGMLGVYGVVAYTAARRQRDIGIRIELGATRSNVRARFVRQALAFAAVGIAIGEVGAAVLMLSLS